MEMIFSEEPNVLDIEDELADFTADLLALKANEPILHRLFANPVGQWSNLVSFLDNHDEIAQQLTYLQADCNGTLCHLVVTS